MKCSHNAGATVARASLQSKNALAAFATAASGLVSVFLLDNDGVILDCSDYAADLYRYPKDEMIGKSLRDLERTGEMPIPQSPYDSAQGGQGEPSLPGDRASKAVYCYQAEHRRRDGSTFPALVSVKSFDDGGNDRQIYAVQELICSDGSGQSGFSDSYLFETLLDSIPDYIYFKDRDSRFITVSRWQLEKFSRSDMSEVVGKTDFDMFTEPHARQAFDDERRIIESGQPLVNFEEVETWPDGHKTYVSTTKMPMRDRYGNIVGIFGLSRDITARKLMEIELEHTAQELARSNAELQHFAYIASHDLQEPLRMIAGFLQLVSRRYKGQLDQEADEFISYAVDGANRMKAMIDGLLAYSRVGTHGKPLEPLNTWDLFAASWMNCEMAIEESGVEFIWGDAIPGTIMGDKVQLTQLFQNLFHNAIKFHRPGTKPQIKVAARRGEGIEWIFSLSDNGIGFDAQSAERIFGIFQRLHSSTEYPGTGIGLAVCKKIVERHGGRIWAESTPGEGSTFFIALRGVDEVASTSIAKPAPKSGGE